MKAHIDRDGCIGCELCTEICPDVFRMAEDGLSEVYGEVTVANVAQVRDAVDSCPTSVISIEE